ncbi:MAG: gliding motility-associated C-terminal domain-containing protein [Bacteroidota bacterium]
MQHRITSLLLSFLLGSLTTYAQFSPISLTGFNQDVVAESGTSALATTTIEMDAISPSNSVMFSTGFAAANGLTAGLPANGTIVAGPDTYQLAPYTGNNVLFVRRNQSADLTLVSPSSFAKIRLLAFSTEMSSTINISLGFTDGTTTSYLGNVNLQDWFNGSGNIALQGYGRIKRLSAGPYTVEGLPNNPMMYYLEVALNCADRFKLLNRISISNVSASGSTLFPNAIFLAASGLSYSQSITPQITAANCNGLNNGSIGLTVTGSSSPYTYSWNTNPVQTSSTATGLAPGNYTCTVTDAGGCATTYNGTVGLTNNATISASASPATICSGQSAQLTAIAGIGQLTTFTWTPGNLSGSSVTVSPTGTTTYTLQASNASGCSATTQVTVTLSPDPSAPLANPISVCAGGNGTLTVQNPVTGNTYNWYSVATGGTILSSGTSYALMNVTASATYYVSAVNATGCTSSTRTAVDVNVNPLPAAPQVSSVTVCSGTNASLLVTNTAPAIVTYRWYSQATGGSPVFVGNPYIVSNVQSPTTWYVEAFTTAGCISAGPRIAVNISLYTALPAPVVTLQSATFVALTFSWTAVPGATAYQVSTDGGLTFQSPSSGASGTTHTISGLTGNTTVSLVVRSLGGASCQTSAWSAPVSGTTLSSKEIFVPNTFTPNGDGRNDLLKVYGNYLASMEFRIFNQWGELIFFTTDITKGWDGTHKGQAQPMGVYAYTLKVVLQDNTVKVKTGSVNLIR